VIASPSNNDKDEGQKPKSGEESSGAPSQAAAATGWKSRSAVEEHTLNKKQGESLAFFYGALPVTQGQPWRIAK